MDDARLLILGANGQIGKALQAHYPKAKAVSRDQLDITNPDAVEQYDWSDVETIINAAAYTEVDEAEMLEGRAAAWRANAQAVAHLARIATTHNITLIHISSEYVFDGTESPHTEDEPFTPLGVYGQSKAAGDIAAAIAPKHYVLRTSWVVGDGKNFVRSILGLGSKQISPNVVADQFGRLTFATEIVRAVDHLLTQKAVYGTYNISNDGDIVSWADVARQIYDYAGFSKEGLKVGDTTAAEYFAGKVSSPRPVHSDLDLTKIKATGFMPHDWRDDLREYITAEQEKPEIA